MPLYLPFPALSLFPNPLRSASPLTTLKCCFQDSSALMLAISLQNFVEPNSFLKLSPPLVPVALLSPDLPNSSQNVWVLLCSPLNHYILRALCPYSLYNSTHSPWGFSSTWSFSYLDYSDDFDLGGLLIPRASFPIHLSPKQPVIFLKCKDHPIKLLKTTKMPLPWLKSFNSSLHTLPNYLAIPNYLEFL